MPNSNVPRRAIVVDDDDSSRELVSFFLQDEGYSVTAYRHPDEVNAIEKKHLGYVDPHGPTIALDLKPIDFQFWVDVCRQVGVLHQPVDAAKIIFE